MAGYSKIKTIRIKNFRNIGDVTLDFEESPIISLIGDNEAGKTSVIKAIGVCALHADPKSQLSYIRDGTKGFGVFIELEDGTQVMRLKTHSSNQYHVKSADGEEWSTTKIDAGLPVKVKEVMGMIEEAETKQYLQIRTYEDLLLFVVTPSSTNYKVMYDALKADQITKAISIGSKEANTLKASITTNDVSMSAILNNLRQIRIIDTEPVVNIKNYLLNKKDTLRGLRDLSFKVDDAKRLSNRLEEYKEINSIEEVDSGTAYNMVEAGRCLSTQRRLEERKRRLEEASQLEIISIEEFELLKRCLLEQKRKQDKIERLEIYEKINSLGSLEYYEIDLMNQLMNTRQRKEKLENREKALKQVDGLEEIVNEIEGISRLAQLVERKKQREQELSILERVEGIGEISADDISIANELFNLGRRVAEKNNLNIRVGSLREEVEKIEKILKESGEKVVVCPRCGEEILVTTE